MKRYAPVMVIAGVVVIALSMAILGCTVAGNTRPFQALKGSEILWASVCLTPPDKTVEIPDREELASYLRDVVIYEKDNSYREYSGQGVTFTLFLTDGSRREVMAFSPFLILDGVGYRTEYEPCEALNSYANELLEEDDAVVVLDNPPALAVVSDNTSIQAMLGGYSWQSRNPDGTQTMSLADSAHPLSCVEQLPVLDTGESTVSLRFTQSPDEILWVRCWEKGVSADESPDGPAILVMDNSFTLPPGSWICQVEARWSADQGWGGTASYSILVNVSPA